jgi:hypothetical protein
MAPVRLPHRAPAPSPSRRGVGRLVIPRSFPLELLRDGGCLCEGVARRPWTAGGIGTDELSWPVESWGAVVSRTEPVDRPASSQRSLG